MTKPRLLLHALLALAGSALAAVAQPVRVVGSDLLAANVGPEIARFAKAADTDIAATLEGSRLAMEKLEKGEADLGLLVFAPGDPLPGEAFKVATAGYLTAVFVAPSSVSINQLHYGQLGGVFGATESVNYSRWSDIGVTGPRGSRSITAMVARGTGLSADLMRNTVLVTPEFKATVVRFDKLDELYARMATEEGGLAVVAVPPPAKDERFKVLLISKNAREVAYGPTPENLHTGDYPLRLPVQLVFRKTDAKRLNFLLRHLLSDETTGVFLRDGVITLPVQARNQLVFELETL